MVPFGGGLLGFVEELLTHPSICAHRRKLETGLSSSTSDHLQLLFIQVLYLFGLRVLFHGFLLVVSIKMACEMPLFWCGRLRRGGGIPCGSSAGLLHLLHPKDAPTRNLLLWESTSRLLFAQSSRLLFANEPSQ